MDYQTAKFYWDTAELALKAGTELDRSRHGRSQEVEVTVQNLLKSLQAAVELSPDRGSISEFEAVFELYRAVISPGPSPYLRTTSDLVKAISAFNDGWLAQLRSPTEAELYSMMRYVSRYPSILLVARIGAAFSRRPWFRRLAFTAAL